MTSAVILEQTFAEWSAWFVENRSAQFEVYSASPVQITPETVLLRIFAPPDGKVPKNGYHLKGPTWEISKKKPKNHLILLYGEGHPPLILAIPNDVGLVENCATRDQSIRKLSPPSETALVAVSTRHSDSFSLVTSNFC